MVVPVHNPLVNITTDVMPSLDQAYDGNLQIINNTELTKLLQSQTDTVTNGNNGFHGVSFASLVMNHIKEIDHEQSIINDAVTNPRSHSAQEALALQNNLVKFAVDSQTTGKVLSILTKGVDGLVHTQ